MDQLRASVSPGGSYIVVGLAGESDANTAGQLRGILETEAAKGSARLIVDLSAVRFIDSAAVHVLLDIWKSVRGHGAQLALVSPQPVVARVLGLMGADQLIPVYDDLGTAVDQSR